ncbi:GIY-YIG nuclease family protein [Leifsonia sp. LS-T14]|uniref:GIY-YIG nuclease family protein n=1 Tax=unclassified Leifsonia TaxID=2663824 RepID=UPI0035A63ECE
MSDSVYQSIFDSDDDGLLETPVKPARISSSDRLERSFLEIVEFYRAHRRTPDSNTRQIAERKLGARLDGILADERKVAALRPLDEYGLLLEPTAPESIEELLDSDDLGLLEDESGLLDTSDLPVRARRLDPDEVAQRVKCLDFDKFEPLFVQKHSELASGAAKLVPFKGEPTLEPGAFFVMAGVMLFVAEVGEEQSVPGIRTRYKRRTRTIFENGTESHLFRRSLAGQLYEHEGYAVLDAEFSELFPDDKLSGYVYVLKSLSEDPQISSFKNLHKIGFSRGPVEQRIANAKNDPTYLMAPVKIEASYRTYNMKTAALEHLLHRVFADVRLDASQIGPQGVKHDPAEWFDVPLVVINRAIAMITSGEIVDYVYEPERQALVPRDD